MPCDGSHCEPTQREIEGSRVACLLDELNADNPRDINRSSWRGYHEEVYGKTHKLDLDAMTMELCERLQKTDVSKFSLEMQIWWRDHQKADAAKARAAIEAKKTEREKAEAIAKLTLYERNLLGL